jgi:hypothetical protein
VRGTDSRGNGSSQLSAAVALMSACKFADAKAIVSEKVKMVGLPSSY